MLIKILLLLIFIRVIFNLIILVGILLSIIFAIPRMYRYFTKILYKFGLNVKQDGKIPNVPCIIVSNYCTKKFKTHLLSYMSHCTISDKLCIVVNDSMPNILSRIYNYDRIIYLSLGKSKNYDYLKISIKRILDKGYNVFVYIEDNDKTKVPYTIKSIKSGVFNIAKDLDVPIVPIVSDSYNWKNIFLPFPISYRIKIGSPIFVKNIKTDMDIVLNWMKKSLKLLSIQSTE